MKNNEEINVIESVGRIGNLKRLLISSVIFLSPFIAYYAGMLGVYGVDFLIYLGETGQHLPIKIPPPSPYPWHYMSLLAGSLLVLIWVAIGHKHLKQIK